MGFTAAISKPTVVAGAAVLLASFATGASGQDSDHILPKWQQGDVVHYRMIRTRNDPKGVLPDDVATTPVTLTVASATEQGFVVEWKQGATTGSRLSEQNPPTREMLKVVERVPLMLEVSLRGEVVGIANWQAVRDEAYLAIDRVFAGAKEVGTTPGLVERVGPAMKEGFSTKEAVTAPLADDARSLLAAMTRPTVASNSTFPGKLRNPAGGPRFETTVSWTARPSSGTPPKLVLQWTHTVTSENFATQMRALITAMMTLAGRTPPDLTGLSGSAAAEGSAEIDLASAWPEFIEEASTVIFNGRTTRDTKRFERVRSAEAGTATAPGPPRH